jgi:hypothetical protein
MTERSDTMPVIGRLDDQVEAILINPHGRRRREPGEDERERPPLPPAATEERGDADSTSEKRETRSTLPVWLL